MMNRPSAVVSVLLLGVLSCSFSKEIHTSSASDFNGLEEEEFVSSWKENWFSQSRLEKGADIFSTSKVKKRNVNQIERLRNENSVSSSTNKGEKRIKRAISNPFLRGIFSLLCQQGGSWRPGYSGASKGSSDRSWSQVLETDSKGNEIAGTKAELLEAVTKGSRIKIRMVERFPYTAEVQNCRTINSDVCCQAFFHITISSWQNFEANSHRWLILVCTTGDMHIVWHKVGGSYTNQNPTSEGFRWFVYRNNDGSYPQPILSTDSSSNQLSGSQLQLARAVRDGKTLTVVRENTDLVPIENVQLQQESVSAQHVWGFGMDVVGNHYEYIRDIYWKFVLLTPSGSRDIARWFYGTHTLGSQTKDVVALDWYAGDDWIRVPHARLKAVVEEGFAIKVKFGTTFVEVDNVMISGDRVSAQVVAMVARENLSTFKADINWEFRTLSTGGTIRTYRPLVGSSNMTTEGNTVENSQIIYWFCDTRKWDLLLHISSNSTVLNGSAQAVREAVLEGADIRVGYMRDGDPGLRFQTVDNFWFSPTPPHLSAQLIRLLRDKNTSDDEFELDDSPVWSFTLLTTEGVMRKTEWLVGEHVNQNRIEENVEIKFFAAA